mmetsp:Transcript_11018/g.41037  ORF Transcript_11018/g.41037 Transcript_11018/m.41037 type:complete len:348 (+) Transcript_11018:1345-2388(+)
MPESKINALKLKYYPSPIEDIPDDAISLEISRDFILAKDAPEDDPVRQKFHELCYPHTDDFGKLIHNTVVIKSPMGSGKTYTTREILAEYAGQRILMISTRRAFVRNVHLNFEDLGFRLYLDKKGEKSPYDADRLICQMESMRHLFDHMARGKMPYFDVVVLDEIETIMGHFHSSTMNRNNNCLNVFNFLSELVRKAHLTIALDADYGIKAHEFLCSIRQPFVIRNSKTRRGMVRTWDIRETKSKEVTAHAVLAELQKYKRTIVCCSSKKTSDFLAENLKNMEEFAGKEAVVVNGDADGKTRKELADPDTFFGKYDYVFYTSIIGPGIDICRIKFDKIIMWISCVGW